ncbi:hypothetical protein [Arthrobacter sp. GMC3]|nr:hypothetical protein [Arthrobacter sp. GMC3]
MSSRHAHTGTRLNTLLARRPQENTGLDAAGPGSIMAQHYAEELGRG